MSSSSDEGNNPPVVKKRHALRACDTCRRRKVKCRGDGPAKQKKTCSNCSSGNVECTYKHGAIKRGPSKKYIERLEDRLNKMEDLFRKFCPGIDIDRELGPRPRDEAWPGEDRRDGGTQATSSGLHSRASPADTPITQLPPFPNVPSEGETEGESDDDLRSGPTFLANWLKSVQINPSAPRLFGRASYLALIRSTFELKNEDSVDTRSPLEIIQGMAERRPEYWRMIPSEARDLKDYDYPLDNPHFEFPDEDLLHVLVNKYFEEINAYWPLLHRPTFEAEIFTQVHHRDKSFAAVLLTICALGARFSDDPRVLLDGVNAAQSPGWKWFRQASVMRRSPWAPPSLYDLQLYGLIARYIVGTSNQQGCWMMVGTGIRLAQDIGVHRRKIFSTVLTPRDELWKRAFWALVDLDRMFAWGFGRSCAIQDEDFDIDLPVECNDEYWGGPTPFRQPPDTPSRMSYFICLLKLEQILALTLRTMYSINKSKAAFGFIGLQKELELIAHLDSAMNKWHESIPDHLRWDPSRKDPLFFSQSALLQTNYYALKITVHRSFLTSTRRTLNQSFPSLSICTNAARALSHVIDIEQKQTKRPLSHQMHHAFIAGTVLLMAIFRNKKNELHLDPAKELADVHKCMNVLKTLEPRWNMAGKLWDILSELSSIGDLSMLQGSGLKRQRLDGESGDDGQSGANSAHAGPRLSLENTQPSMHSAFSSSSGATAEITARSSIPSWPQFAGLAIPPSAPPTDPLGYPPTGMNPMYQELLVGLSAEPLTQVPKTGDSSAAPYFGAIGFPNLGTQQSFFDSMQASAVGASLNPLQPGICPNNMNLPSDLSTLFDVDAFSLPDAHTESASLQPATALNNTLIGEWEWFLHATNGYPEYQPHLQSHPQPDSYAQSANIFDLMDGLPL